ncbi:MAG TPA: hypothetical protein PK199_10765, partial [Bacteroidales bacterium]|nr:hypothetical protein [Bacteroidales bacterium]
MKQLFLTITFLCISLIVSQSFAQCTKPNPPVITNSEICIGEPNNALTAQGQNITWYGNQEKTIVLQTNSNSYTPTVTNDNTYMYYATQTVNSCESDVAPAIYTIKQKPANPLVTGAMVCEGQTTNLPILVTNLGVDKWYNDAAAKSLLGTGYYYQVQASEFGSVDRNFYVVRSIQGCNSDIIPVKLTVIKKPTFSIGNDIAECVAGANKIIQANNFNPSINEYSEIHWSIRSNNETIKEIVSLGNTDNSIMPSSFLTIDDFANYTFYIEAQYVYKNKPNDFTCPSNTIWVKYELYRSARIPIVYSPNNFCENTEIQTIRAFGSPLIVWESKNGLPTSYGTEYNFSQLGIDKLASGNYTFDVYDKNYAATKECPSEKKTFTFSVLPCHTRQGLLHIIDSAKNLLLNAQELKTYKTYTKGAKAALQSKIDAAQLVYNSLSSTSDQLKTASEDLLEAIAEFHSEEVAIDYIESHDVTVSPNPAITTISIQGIPVDEIRSVMLYNQFGVLVLQSHTHRLDIA